MIRLILYGTLGCHLCEDAETLLSNVIQAHGAEVRIETIDIAEIPGLEDRYGLRIPVLQEFHSGAELGWPFDEEQVSVFLRNLA